MFLPWRLLVDPFFVFAFVGNTSHAAYNDTPEKDVEKGKAGADDSGTDTAMALDISTLSSPTFLLGAAVC